jgi:demethoxyubiquinone hydroxylase (CLK1/Coq7/Cat5 family)
MGKETAMALTEAIETVIGSHYNEYPFSLISDIDRVSDHPMRTVN